MKSINDLYYEKIHNSFFRILSDFIINKEKRKEFRYINFYRKLEYFNTFKLPENNIYQKDKEELLKNLDEEAKNNCLKILNRIEKTQNKKYFTLKNTFTKEEIKDLLKAVKYINQIKKINDYYQLDNYKLPINHFISSVFYYKHGIDILKTFDKLGDKAIIDVGCFIADSCLIFRDYTKNTIYTFEPDNNNYKLAQKTIELNNLQDIVLENLALGDKEEENEILIDGSSSSILGNNGCNFINSSKQVIKTTRLDKYVKEHNIKVGLIKVDIEGFEPYFLKGAIETIKEQKPIILLSIYHNYHDFFKLKLFIESLNCGYKFNFFKGMDGSLYGETLLICEVY